MEYLEEAVRGFFSVKPRGGGSGKKLSIPVNDDELSSSPRVAPSDIIPSNIYRLDFLALLTAS